MSDLLEKSQPPEEISIAHPNSFTALWRIIQIDEEDDRFESAEIVMESTECDTTTIQCVLDEVESRYNQHGKLRAKVAQRDERIEELQAEVDRLRAKVKERDKDFLGKEADNQIYKEALSRISEQAFPVNGPFYIKHIRALKEIADDALKEAEGGE